MNVFNLDFYQNIMIFVPKIMILVKIMILC